MASEVFPLPHPTANLHTIFVDSNIDSHLALVVSLYDTISEVKAKIAAEHALCFQGIGEIGVQAIKVRRRGFFYNLADSMYVLNAFDGVRGSWFVCIDIVPICTVKNQKIPPNKVTNEHVKHNDNAVPVLSEDKHQEIVFCRLSPKNIDPDGQKSLNPGINHVIRPTMLIDQEKGGEIKNDCKNLCTEARDVMPSATCTHKTISSKTSTTSQQDKLLESQSQHYIVEKKSGKKRRDGLREERLEVCKKQKKINTSEDIGESNKSTNASPDGKKEILTNYSEGLLNKLPHENAISLQNSPLEKHSKKRKSKSSKSHEVACLAMPSETAVVRSIQVITDTQNSGKEVNASISSGKCPIEPNIEKLLPDDGDMRTTLDTTSFVDVVHGTGTKDSKTGIVSKAKNTKQSGKQNLSSGRIKSESSLHETRDKPKLDKKLHNYEPESHVQLSKSGAIGDKQRKKTAADGKGKTHSLVNDHDIDIMASKDDVRQKVLNSSTTSNPVGDAVGSSNVDVFQSDVMATEVASSDSTEDTTYQKGRYRFVRKNPIINCSESHLEEVQTKPGALKIPMDINFFGTESNELGKISKKADGRTKNHSSSILKSSISYKKSKSTASQSEFLESQPMDMVLQTQPESAAP